MMRLEKSAPLQRNPDRSIVNRPRGMRKTKRASGHWPFRGSNECLEGFGGIHQDGDRPFIHQFHLHHFLEAAGFTA